MFPRGDLLTKAPLVLPPDVDDDLVAGPQPVILRRGLVLVRLEGQRTAPEHIPPEDLARVGRTLCRVRYLRVHGIKASGRERLRRIVTPLPALAGNAPVRDRCPSALALLVFLFQTLHLRRCHATRQQLLPDLPVALARAPCLKHVLPHSFVAHLGVCRK